MNEKAKEAAKEKAREDFQNFARMQGWVCNKAQESAAIDWGFDAGYEARTVPADECECGHDKPAHSYSPSDGVEHLNTPRNCRKCACKSFRAKAVPADGEVRVAVDICETLRIGILREADTPRPFCRDCADEDGICPRTNFPCDLREAADALRSLIATASANRQPRNQQE